MRRFFMLKHTCRIMVSCAVMCAVSACDYMPSMALFGFEEKKDNRLQGERLKVLRQEGNIEIDDAIQSTPLVLPAVYMNQKWTQHNPMYSSDAGNLGLTGDLVRMEYDYVGDDTEFSHTLIPLPVVADGVVYAMDAEGSISAHKADDVETVLWRIKGVSQEDEEDILGGGLAYRDGVIYATSGRGMVGAFDAKSGTNIWKQALNTPLRSAPTVADGRLYSITMNNQLYVLNINDGEIMWTHLGIPESAAIMNSVAPTVSGDMVIVPYSSGQVYALSVADGREIWSDSLARGKNTEALSLLSGIGGDPIIDGDAVISVSSGGTLVVHSIVNGKRAWEKPIGSINTPWVVGEWIYILSSYNTLVCLHKYDGRVRWATQLASYENEEKKKDPINWRGPVLADGKLLLVSSIGQLAEVDSNDGHMMAVHEIPEDIYTSPVVVNGVVYLIDQDATLYAIR